MTIQLTEDQTRMLERCARRLDAPVERVAAVLIAWAVGSCGDEQTELLDWIGEQIADGGGDDWRLMTAQ
jgi:hypothetical protein